MLGDDFEIVSGLQRHGVWDHEVVPRVALLLATLDWAILCTSVEAESMRRSRVCRAPNPPLSRVHPYRVGVQSEPDFSSPTYLPCTYLLSAPRDLVSVSE